MAQLLQPFDATQHEPAGEDSEYQVLPEGEYTVIVTESEIVPIKSQMQEGGKQLQLTYKVIEGQYAGSEVKEWLGLYSTNPKGRNMGERKWSAVCNAVGKQRISDSREVHDIPLKIKVKVKARNDDQSKMTNDVVHRFSAGGGVAPQQQAPQTHSPYVPPQQRSPQQPANAGVLAGQGVQPSVAPWTQQAAGALQGQPPANAERF